MSYHHTDTVGQAIEAARAAHVTFRGALVDLDRELGEERELHRGEVMRQVERAEAAEDESARLARRVETMTQQLADLVGHVRSDHSFDSLLAVVRELAAADPSRVALMVSVRQQRERIEMIERHLVEERDARRDAEDRADDAERATRLANDRADDLDHELGEMRRAAQGSGLRSR